MPTLDWTGKNEAITAAQKIPYRLLEFDESLSCGDKFSGNMIIQGDNLEVLKSLLPIYRGRIKCVYIDPPYNTGSAFEHYDDNLEHSTWLNMMYPRLELLREFLADDGSIWISIDDDEAHYLKIICDEIFGRNNFVASIVWQKKYGASNDAKWISDTHDYILVYALKKDSWRPNLFERTEAQLRDYKNPDNDPRGLWRASDLSARTYSANCDYEIIGPTGKIFKPPPTRAWTVSKENFHKLDSENKIWWGKNSDARPMRKKFLSEVKQGITPETWWARDFAADNKIAKYESKILFEDFSFMTPKPEKLIEKILTLATKACDLVLDSFLGSGTTAAVAHKMNRRYIGIEMGAQATTHIVPRLKKVIAGEQGGISKSVGWTGGGGFNFYRIGEKLFDEMGRINPVVTFAQLAAYIWFKFTETPYIVKTPPLIGIHEGTAYYLLDEILTRKTLSTLPAHDGKKIIFGKASRIGAEDLKLLDITFLQIPKDVR